MVISCSKALPQVSFLPLAHPILHLLILEAGGISVSFFYLWFLHSKEEPYFLSLVFSVQKLQVILLNCLLPENGRTKQAVECFASAPSQVDEN